MSNMTSRGRASRVRHKLKSLSKTDKFRLSCFRSNTHIYAQVVDDANGVTLASASTVDKKLRKDIKKGDTIEAATVVGKELAVRAKKAGVETVYFDRGANRYAGRVKALADAARDGGLQF